MSHALPREFSRAPLSVAILGGALAIAPLLAPGTALAADGNSSAKIRPMLIARACNPCAAKKAGNPCNPCAGKRWAAGNPCAAKRACNPCNPCAARKACNPGNPCAARKACNPCNPCAAKKACNPCNPCGAGSVSASQFKRPAGTVVPVSADPALLARGERLWNDKSLGSNGLACETCHTAYGNFNATFAEPYPHRVAMPDSQAGVKSVTADEMVQFCLIVPLATKPLAWGSEELKALTSYTIALQHGYDPGKAARAGSPCNPCAASRASSPCNPCAAKRACNPCAVKGAGNPCAAKKAGNPCNPCAATRKRW